MLIIIWRYFFSRNWLGDTRDIGSMQKETRCRRCRRRRRPNKISKENRLMSGPSTFGPYSPLCKDWLHYKGNKKRKLPCSTINPFNSSYNNSFIFIIFFLKYQNPMNTFGNRESFLILKGYQVILIIDNYFRGCSFY